MSTIIEKENKKIGKLIQYLANQNRAYVNTLLKEEGLTYGECNILLIIKMNGGLSQEELRQHIKTDKSAITRIIKNLVDKGYVIKERNEEDNRSFHLYLTMQAETKMPRIYEMLKQGSNRLLEALDSKEEEEIMRLLTKICSYIETKGDKE